MIIVAFTIVAKPVSRNVENYELVRKQRGDRLALLAVGGVLLIGSATVWALFQRIRPPDSD
jgi:hypothetical protein